MSYVDRRRFLGAAATGSLALALEPRVLAARLGGTPVAFVTADLESHVVVLDLETTKVVRRIPTGPGPRSIESVRDRIAVVAHTEHGALTLLGAAKSRIRAELGGFEAPRYTAVHPRLPLAYVTDSSREEVVVVDAERAEVVARARVPGPARHIAISPDGHMLWTALGTAASRVAVLDSSDPRRPKLIRTITPPFLAHDVVFAPDGRTAWATSGAERRIAIYRGERRAVRILAAGAPPQHVTFTRDKAFVASGDDGTVRRHRLDGDFVREARVPLGSYNVTFGWSRVVTPSLAQGTASVLDRNGRLRTIEKVARAAHDACIVFGP
jgi:DNA-binding beta-propeller fold protein YncE